MACGSRTAAVLRHAAVDGRLLRARLDPAQAPRLYRPTCTTAVPGNQTCPANNQRAVDPANPGVLLPSAYIGNIVPGSGSQINGMIADGYPGMRPGEYFSFTPFVAAPRVGFAWDINGDGKQALRASRAVLRDTHTRGVGRVRRHAPAAFNRQVRWASSATSRTSPPRRRSSRRRSPRSTPAAKHGRSRSPTT